MYKSYRPRFICLLKKILQIFQSNIKKLDTLTYLYKVIGGEDAKHDSEFIYKFTTLYSYIMNITTLYSSLHIQIHLFE